MEPAREALPDDVAALKAALAAERAQKLAIEAELAIARAKASEDMALIAQQKLRIAKLERQVYGQRSERSARLIEQLALESKSSGPARRKTSWRRRSRRPDDERSRLHPAARGAQYFPGASSPRTGGDRSSEEVRMLRRSPPAQARRGCDADAGDGAAPVEGDRDRAGEVFLPRLRGDLSAAGSLSCRPQGMGRAEPACDDHVERFGQHQPLNRQCERYALEGAPIALSTLADAVGAVAAAIDPLRRLIEAHVLAAERLHGDDTTVPVLAKGKTDTARCWIYVRDGRPSGRRPSGRDLLLFAGPQGRASAKASDGIFRHSAGRRL